ncbi:related to SOK1 protein [Cephalotrichum gorgonifer]|uniref:Related to SOK1 protein n=1 Tax=Cephalotrichum gorgonifer TaxID=2041049 RepID=A0AAE8N5G7_9PEZI|nr:related to SOK1 protein [Cephalotrichum gorgonifer]
MSSEQGPGGGALGGSPPLANTQNEPMQDADVENRMSQQQDDSQAQYAQPSQVSPRRLEDLGTPAAGTPTTTPFTHSYPSARSSNSSSPINNSSSQRIAKPLEPPVTKATLSELDVTKIIHNPKLRHDINFDPDLHFRPNLEGEKGRKKQDRANQFWHMLREQLTDFVVDRDTFHAKHGHGDDWCLPSLLKAVKDIIQTLVPQRDRVYLEEGLNVGLLMQQFNRGVADLEKLASWLSHVLKSHCAPMRDEWVDEMYNELSGGNKNNDMGELVKGMRSLLSVLEAMKLDVANHQIRCLRPVLIEDTVHFEQRFFFKKIESRKLDVGPAKLWYGNACERYSALLTNPTNAQSFGDMTIFFDALSRLLLPSVDEKTVPNTFLFDEERIMKLRSDMMDIINLEVCMKAYEEMEFGYDVVSALQGLGDRRRPGTPDSVFSASTSLASSSRPSSMVLSVAGSANPSPRSSIIIPSLPAPDAGRSKLKAQELYSSLIAILQTAPVSTKPMARWEAIAPAMAVQVFRFTNAPPHALPMIERNITSLVCDVHSARYRELEEYFLGKLIAELAKVVKQFRGLSGVSLFTVAAGGRVQGGSRAWDGNQERDGGSMAGDVSMRESREDEGIEDMASRLAHLGILHWRVWGALAYSEDEDVSMETPADI